MSASRLKRSTLFCYSAGSLVETCLYGFCGLYLMNFYTDVVHLDPRLIGFAFSIRFLADAFTDPLVGFLSDRTRSRLGRRRPYFPAGAICAALFFYLLLTPPRGSEGTVFLWLTVMSSLLITSLTVFGIPYLALSWELSTDYDERTRISGWRRGFEVLAEILATLMIPVMLALAVSGGPDVAEQAAVKEAELYPLAAMILGGIAVVAAGLATMGTREAVVSESEHQVGVIEGVRLAFSNRPFVILLLTFTLIAVADRAAMALLFYLLEYLHGVPKQDAIPLFLMFFAGSLVSPVLWMKLSSSLGKKQAYQVAMSCWAVVYCGFAATTWPGPALYLVVALMGAASSGVLILPGAIIPDVIEWEQARNGLRREGVYAGIAKFSWKVGTGLCFLLIGQLLHVVGYDGETVPSSAVLQGLQFVFLAVLSGLALAAVLIFRRFPMTADSFGQLRQQIESQAAPSP